MLGGLLVQHDENYSEACKCFQSEVILINELTAKIQDVIEGISGDVLSSQGRIEFSSA